jgi:signal transduction histidine kinase
MTTGPGAPTRVRSLSRDLTRSLLAGLLLLVVLLMAVVYFYARSALLRQFDYALASKARALATLVQEEASGALELEFADEVMPEFEHGKSPEFFEVWRPDGSTLERSKSLRGSALAPFSGELDKAVTRNVTLPDGRSGRAVGMRFMPQYEAEEKSESAGMERSDGSRRQPAVIVVARSRHALDRTLLTLASVLATGVLALALGTILIVMLVVKRGLQPILHLADQTRELGPGNPGTRLDRTEAVTELQPIYQGVNDLLDRLEQAFDRERRFTSDVSHELRTPIAEARASLEMSLKWPDDAALLASSSHSAVDALKQMENLVKVLLTLARAEAGRADLTSQDLDLRQIVDRSVSLLEPACESRGIRVAVNPEIPGRAPVQSSRVMLEAIVSNLLSNAAEYAAENTTVNIVVESSGEGCRLTITNEAPLLTPDDVRVMTEPFWRKDPARSDSRHSGLGLAVVRSFCKCLGIACDWSLGSDGMLTAELRIPAGAE